MKKLFFQIFSSPYKFAFTCAMVMMRVWQNYLLTLEISKSRPNTFFLISGTLLNMSLKIGHT